MNNFKKPHGNRRNSGRTESRAPSRARSPRRAEATPRFDAVCSNCGTRCQVPFRPNGTRPVYCKNCFDAPREASSSLQRHPAIRPAAAGMANHEGGKSIADLTRQIAAMNVKIDTMLRIIQDGEMNG